MDALGVVNMNADLYGNIPKDERALHQQRAVLLTAEDTVAKYKAYNIKQAPKREKAKQLKAFNDSIKSLTPDEKKVAKERRRLEQQLLKVQQKLQVLNGNVA